MCGWCSLRHLWRTTAARGVALGGPHIDRTSSGRNSDDSSKLPTAASLEREAPTSNNNYHIAAHIVADTALPTTCCRQEM
ncbi:uncharacterized protein ColSpa_04637 [Colletotrichum spaethianum]|uniref:Uncharacterized protein n=1 Tax=Colletotrichum spaethianum TaxID=700344 RepID=A0AA37L9B5_9PEZI|nr:uncharacterized protein ColSpa_04637 [Colletotrichum spaethianum]GKT44456.1 hypothetical protein ColSpa_04637 [Colletotrichum spaethianum]